jgi:hypothetical protein
MSSPTGGHRKEIGLARIASGILALVAVVFATVPIRIRTSQSSTSEN